VQQAMDDLLLHRAQGKVAIRVSQREGADWCSSSCVVFQ
jgi:hypothetical protein